MVLSSNAGPISVWSRFLGGLALCFLLGGLSACRTPPQCPPTDLSEAGWRIRHGQAVWRPAVAQPETAGELMLATHTDGRWVLQFSKTPFLIASAQSSPTQWRIEFPLLRRSWSGVSAPPTHLGWMQFYGAQAGATLPSAWRWHQAEDGQFRLESLRSGETMSGYLGP
jgi:hypothetical protein